MKLNNNSKFDIDLKYGQVREKRVADLLGKEQVEIKTERSWWRKTGNIAFEYEYRDKPSGIDKTEAKWWFHILELEKKEHCMLVFRVSRLKKIVNKYKATHSKNIGDYRASKCVVLPLKELFSEECIKIK
jgi:hypothetical protein|tara:strand:- start:5939 stop:6328 length:390 start_codon:yes stop_codon:yes gene_type:complete